FPSDNPITQQIDGKSGMGFALSVVAIPKGGLIYADDNSLHMENCDEVVLLVATSTGFLGYNQNPQTDPLIVLNKTMHRLNLVRNKDWEEIKNAHLKEYQTLYSKVSLDLMTTPNKNSIPNRLVDLSKGKDDRGLIEILFQLGRYLLISCSREGTQPANLQGLWNEEVRPPWSSNYTLNINTQMNYWAAENCGLSECHMPLFDMLKELSITGSETAKNEYGMGGWVCHHNTDIWRQTAPVGVREENPVTYAFWPMGSVWLSTHLWEHYQFNMDKKFLSDTAFPILRGATQFMLDYLICDESGQYITSPSTSPENTFILNTNVFSAYKMSTMDLFLLRELFAICISCCNILAIEPEFRKKCETVLAGLPSPNISSDGRLLEWYEDFEEVDPNHRHVSHLFGLFPGSQKIKSEFADSCKKSLERRGDDGTGWSLAWKANLWARLGEGEHAYRLIMRMLRLIESTGVNMHDGGGVYPNLFCAHPPFQID
ncbi:MAG: glycoside hydrolase family 95 protein, partial [Oscillospiraceae bacterium]